MRTAGIALALLLSGSTSPLLAQEYGPEPDAVTRAEILQVREAAWRTWFANDQAGFQRVVPAELVAMGWGGGPWEDRQQTLAQMGEFARGGWTLDSLAFPKNVFQQYGEVVILYTAFRLVLRDGAGNREDTAGRGTEVFVRRGGRWIHTGWHLDTVAY